MQLLFFYISYRFNDTRRKQKNRFFSKGYITSQTCKKAHKKNTGLLFLATLQHIQSSSKSERDTCVTSLVRQIKGVTHIYGSG